jgi:hypothetical protein
LNPAPVASCGGDLDCDAMATPTESNGRGLAEATATDRMAEAPGLGAKLDRGAWAALSQTPRSAWSWPRAIVTVGAAMTCAGVIYVTVYPQPAFLIALAVVYVLLVFRARTVEHRYGGTAGS